MIRELINSGESKKVEFKQDLSQKNQIPKTVCAFANRAGGYIIIGVSDDGDVVGVDDELLEDYLDRIANIIHDKVYPMVMPELYTYRINNKSVIVIQIYPGNAPPYYLKSEGKLKGTYVRVGKTNKQADIEMLQELERRRLNKSFDEDINREADSESIDKLARLLGNVLERDITDEKLKNLNLIVPSGDQWYLTNASLILMGQMDNCCIKCARFAGDMAIDFIDLKEYTGDIFGQLYSVIGFIKNHINMSGVISGSGLKRKDIFEIPEEVLREAVVNALVHRDYSISGSDIKIAVYNSRIDIISPGGLPKAITVDEIYAGRSELRNKTIARIFREAGIIEQWGSGIPRIRNICRREGIKPPEISEDGMFVKLTIYRRNNRYTLHESPAVYFTSTSKTNEIVKEKEMIYGLVKEKGDYTLKEIAEIAGISEQSAQRRLDALQKDNRIIRAGSKKKGVWKAT